MSSTSFDSRLISTSRNVRQRCKLKYAKFGLFSWDKWTTYDGTFNSFVDANNRQQDRIELHSQRHAQDSAEKIIELSGLQSLTSMHGSTGKDEPRDIIILKISGKKHRLGFDNIYDYNQWKMLLDGVYNAAWDMTGVSHATNESTVNMLYDSVNAQRHRVRFADAETQEILALPTDVCELVVDPDKLVLEQRHERQYTFPRSVVRTLRLVDDNTVEYELGGRAPVQGFVRFRFETSGDARACLSSWKEGTIPKEALQQAQVTVRQTSYRLERAAPSTRFAQHEQYDSHSMRLPPSPLKKPVTNRPLYQIDEPLTLVKANVPSNDYATFQTLV